MDRLEIILGNVVTLIIIIALFFAGATALKSPEPYKHKYGYVFWAVGAVLFIAAKEYIWRR